MTQVCFTVITLHLYKFDVSLEEAVIKTFFNMLWITLSSLLAHIVITMAGLLFVEAEILRCSNENILDSLQEGVIILSEDKNEMHYLNRAARNISNNFMKAD